MTRPALALVTVLLAAALSGCASAPPEEVPSPDTFECRLDGQRWLVRFTDGEARLLSPDGQRINLYQVATGSGVRFTNGLIELRGKGMDLAITQENLTRQFVDCKPLMVPKEDPNPMLRMWQPPPATPLGK